MLRTLDFSLHYYLSRLVYTATSRLALLLLTCIHVSRLSTEALNLPGRLGLAPACSVSFVRHTATSGSGHV